jgi:hypothetical protein
MPLLSPDLPDRTTGASDGLIFVRHEFACSLPMWEQGKCRAQTLWPMLWAGEILARHLQMQILFCLQGLLSHWLVVSETMDQLKKES